MKGKMARTGPTSRRIRVQSRVPRGAGTGRCRVPKSSGEVPEWSTRSPGAILNREAARRAAGRMPAVNGLDSTNPRSGFGRRRRPAGARSVSSESNQVYERRQAPSILKDRVERCQSGRMGLTRNQVYGLPYRGFESHPLRQKTKRPPRGAFLFSGGVRLRTSNPVRPTQSRSHLNLTLSGN